MRRFPSPADASRWLAPLLDVPTPRSTQHIAPGLQLERQPLVVDPRSGAFTNTYTLSWNPHHITASLHAPLTPLSPLTFTRHAPNLLAGATGSYFFLADDCDARPRVLNLNLCLQRGELMSVPVVDQEALVSADGVLRTTQIEARGTLLWNGKRMCWAGSRTQHEGATCWTYGNANSVIQHRSDAEKGRVRHFLPESRWTPPIEPECNLVDVGLERVGGAQFKILAVSPEGAMDIFAHHVVLRLPARYATLGSHIEFETIGSLTLNSIQDAVSVGPLLSCGDLQGHPLNREPSMGSTPLLSGRRAARLVFARASDGTQALCLCDARPGSARFTGVTLEEMVAWVRSRFGDDVEGCFLDSGHTSKLCVRSGADVETLGNRHYLRWPQGEDERGYVWTPDVGRACASLIGLMGRDVSSILGVVL